MTDGLWLSAEISAKRCMAAARVRDADVLLRNALELTNLAQQLAGTRKPTPKRRKQKREVRLADGSLLGRMTDEEIEELEHGATRSGGE